MEPARRPHVQPLAAGQLPEPPAPPQPPQPGQAAALAAAGQPLAAGRAPRGRYTYLDPPRYPVIAQYEGRLKDSYAAMLQGLGRALGQQMGRFIHQSEAGPNKP